MLTTAQSFFIGIISAICFLTLLIFAAAVVLFYFKRKLQIATVSAFFKNSEHPLEQLEWDSQGSRRSASVEIAVDLEKKDNRQATKTNPVTQSTKAPHENRPTSSLSGPPSDPPLRSLPGHFLPKSYITASSTPSPSMASTFITRSATVQRAIPSKPASHHTPLYPSISADGGGAGPL